MFSVNNFFEIGSTHAVCQDYSLSGEIIMGEGKYYYGIVCDGCSSSLDVDIGARLLAISAKQYITSLFGHDLEQMIYAPDVKKVADNIVANLKIIDPDLLINNSFDSTLILFIANDKNATIYTYGDGFVVMKTVLGGIEKTTYHEFVYESNAPYYLSYKLNPVRNAGYLGQYGSTKYICKYVDVGSAVTDFGIDEVESSDSANTMTVSFDGFDQVHLSIFSDGLASFKPTAQNPNRDFIEQERIVSAYSNYPQSGGKFVERNFLFNRKRFAKAMIEHFDDLSCASMVKG